MRTTWLILLAMVVAGFAMYYFANRQRPVAPHDTIALANTPDSIRQKLRIFIAYDPSEVTFRDSNWYEHDSIPLKEIPLTQSLNTFNKQYTAATLYIDYGHQWFYDVAVKKPTQDAAFDLSFTVNSQEAGFLAQCIINDPLHDQLRLSGPMMKMYSAFLLTYGSKLPADSTHTDTSAGPQAPLPDRLITVLKK